MHELSLMESLVDAGCEQAAHIEVLAVRLEVGREICVAELVAEAAA